MRHGLRRLTGLAATTLLALGWGCGGGPAVETSTTEATVKGTVTIKGKPATEGSVTFDPSNINRKSESPRSAPIGKDGTYSVKTLVGLNQVTFSIPAIAKDAQLQDARLEYVAEPGEHTFDIVLPPSGTSP